MGLPVGLVGSVPAGTAAAPVGPTRPVAGSAGPATPGPVAAYTPYAGAAAAPGAAPWVPVASDAAAGAPSRAPWESAAAGTASTAPDAASAAAGTASGASGPVLASAPAGASGAPAADPAPGPAGAPPGAPWESAAPDPAGAAWESAVSAVVSTASVASDAASDPASVAAGPATCLVSRVLPAGLSAGVVPAGTAGSADGESGVVVMGAVCQTRAALIHALRPGAGPRPAQGPVAGKAGHATNDHRPWIHQGTLGTARACGFATGSGSTRGLAWETTPKPRRVPPALHPPRDWHLAARPAARLPGPGERGRRPGHPRSHRDQAPGPGDTDSANILTMLPTGGVGQPIGSQ